MEINEAYVALASQLHRLVKSLSSDEARSIASGSSRLEIVSSGQRIVIDQPGLDLALKALKALTDQDRARMAAGGSSFKIAHKGGKVVYPVNVSQIAQDVTGLPTEDSIIKFLDADDRLKPTDLRKIATELGIGVPSALKPRDALIAHIARSVVSFGA